MTVLNIHKYLKVNHKFGFAYIRLYTTQYFVECVSTETVMFLETEYLPILVYDGSFINKAFEGQYRELIKKRIETHVFDIELIRRYTAENHEYTIQSKRYMKLFEDDYSMDSGRMVCFEDIIDVYKIEKRNFE